MGTLILAYPREIDEELPMEGKFIQLRWAGREYLLFASAEEHRYTATTTRSSGASSRSKGSHTTGRVLRSWSWITPSFR
jgi:hypothetical protein